MEDLRVDSDTLTYLACLAKEMNPMRPGQKRMSKWPPANMAKYKTVSLAGPHFRERYRGSFVFLNFSRYGLSESTFKSSSALVVTALALTGGPNMTFLKNAGVQVKEMSEMYVKKCAQIGGHSV